MRLCYALSVVTLLAASVIAGNVTWNTASGTWDGSATNWIGDRTTYADGDDVTFNTPAAAANVNIAAPVAPGSIRINTASTANYFTFTNADIVGAVGLTQGGGGWVQFSGRNQWSFGGEVVSSNGIVILNPPTLANNDLCHLGTNTIRLSGASAATHGKFRYTPNTTATGTGVDQDIAVSGFGTLQTHQSGNVNAALAFGKTVTLEGAGATTLLLEDYTGGGNGGYMVIASNGTIRLAGGASDTREIRLNSFNGNAAGFLLGGQIVADAAFTNRLRLGNVTAKDLRLTGNNAAFSKGFQVLGLGGAVEFSSSAAMGATNAGAATTLIDRGGYLGLLYAFTSADLGRIDPASTGTLGLDANSNAGIDLSPAGLNAAGLLIGGTAARTYTGVISPHDSTYAFGGCPNLGVTPPIGTLQFGSSDPATDNLLTGARAVTVEGSPSNSATFRLQVANNNDYTGGTTVKARGLLSVGRTGGTPFGSGRVVILPDGALGAYGTNGTFYSGTAQFTNYLAYAGARYILDDTPGSGALYLGGNGGQGRWGDAAPLALNGGYLAPGAPKNGTSYETIGVLSFEQGSGLRPFNGGGTVHYLLTAASLTRIGRGTLRVSDYNGTDAATLGPNTYRLRCAWPPAVSNNMIAPHFYDTGNRTFYTYSTASDAYGTVGFTNIVFTLSGATVLNNPPAATDLVNQSSDLTLNNSPTVHALKTAQLAGPAYTVTVTGGGLIFSANNKTHTANFSFGNAEGFLWADAGQQTLSGTLTGTNGLTKGGASTVLLSANNTATLKGPVTVNQGALQLNHATALGQTNDLFVGYGATLNVNEQTNLQVGNLGGHGTIMLNGRAITVYGRLNPGSIGSVGRLTISQTGTVAFASGAAMTFDLGALARLSDSLLVSQAHVSLNGALVSINNVDGMAAGAYTLIATSGGSMTGSPGALLLPPGFGGVLSVINNNLVLTISGATQGTMVTVR